MRWWVADYYNVMGPAYVLSWVVWVLGSIILHELAHGWAAIRCGDRTPIELGRTTFNPLVHMSGMSLLMFAAVGIAWGVMPIDPSRFRRRTDDAFVAFAGPGMNLILAFSALILGSLWIAHAEQFVPGQAYNNLKDFFVMGVKLNLVLMAFNLLPIPPLDGSTILATYSEGYRRLRNSPNFGTIGLVIFLVVFFRLFPYIWSAARETTDVAFNLLLGVLR
ncbi:MAG: site-2 protease family protein [Planctomycetota bacterium]